MMEVSTSCDQSLLQSEQEFCSLPCSQATATQLDLPELPSDTRKWTDSAQEALQIESEGPHDAFYVLHMAEIAEIQPDERADHQFIMRHMYFNIDAENESSTYAMKKLLMQLEELVRIQDIDCEEFTKFKGKIELMKNFVREVQTFLEIRKSATDIGAVCASLFKEFTRLVSPFLRAGNETERKAIVFGNDVASAPCMRGYSQKYVQYDGNHVKFTVAAITTVAACEDEETNTDNEAEGNSIKCIPADESGAGDSFISSSTTPMSRALSHFDVPVSRQLLAQHSGELLLELPFSCFTNPDQNVMMGFVLNGTKVRLTTLLMEKRHLVSVMSGKPLNPLYRSQLIYSHPLDLLKKEDRSFLLELLLRLQPYIAMN